MPIKILAEYGKISTKGRYKNQPSPYGMCLIQISRNDDQTDLDQLIERAIVNLIAHKQDLTDSGVDEIIVQIGSPADAASETSLSQKVVHLLSELNAKVELYSLSNFEEVEAI